MDDIFEEERLYLEKVNEIIRQTIEETSKRHNAISKEKLSWEDRLRGQHLNNNAIMDRMYRHIKKMKEIASSPYFGRMDFTVNGSDVTEKIYVGKSAIIGENNKLYTVDWRTPIASMYYDDSVGEAFYEAPIGTINGLISLKRQIIIENAILQQVFDVDLVGRERVLQEYLDVHANDRMKNIVASIQKEQNQVIRHTGNRDIIVQGIAGSGKTSVALHRIAYLMYLLNSGSDIINSQQFMIIGPNKYFLDYISSVLPDLDVDQANQLTLSGLILDIIKEKVTVEDQSKELQEYFKSGTKDVELVPMTSNEFNAAIDKYVEWIYDYYCSTDIVYNGNIIFSKDFIASRVGSKNIKPSTFASNIQKILISKVKEDYNSSYGELEGVLTESIRDRLKKLPSDSEIRPLLFKQIDLIRQDLKTGLSKTIKDHFQLSSKTVLQHYINFIRNLELYANFEGIEEFKAETLKRLSKKKVSRSDIAPLILIKSKLFDSKEFKGTIHIVIDEAQDLSLLEFKALKSLFPSATFSIFGDLNQAIFSYRSIQSWQTVSKDVFGEQCDLYELNQSYRTTDEIMQEANKVSSHLTGNISEDGVRHGEPVDYLYFPKQETPLCIKNLIAEYVNAGYKSIAIITKTEDEAIKINSKLKEFGVDIHNVSSKETVYNGGVCTIASSLVKGLEFDSTILVNVNDFNYDIENDIDMKLLYVAMTRALHKTTIMCNSNLPSILESKKNRRTLQK